MAPLIKIIIPDPENSSLNTQLSFSEVQRTLTPGIEPGYPEGSALAERCNTIMRCELCESLHLSFSVSECL